MNDLTRNLTMSDQYIFQKMSLVPFDITCLEKSWNWLNDPEIRELTMTPEFSREEQSRVFESLSKRNDYIIWGVSLNGVGVIGATGLKNHRGSLAEYWGYIGEKNLWGKGLGKCLISIVEKQARVLGFSELDLKVAPTNKRAIALYEKSGFTVDLVTSSKLCLRMIKRVI